MKRRLIILVGPPGSGKGTQAELLQKDLHINYFSVGEILRREVENKTDLGNLVIPYLKTGKLAPDELIGEIMVRKLNQTKKDLIFDGFPRNLDQAKFLDSKIKTQDLQVVVLAIDLPIIKVIERIAGRRYCVCGKTYHVDYKPPTVKGVCDRCGDKLKVRSDSKLNIIKERLKIYDEQTRPILRYYKNKENYLYYKIRGGQSIDKVHQDILEIMNNIK